MKNIPVKKVEKMIEKPAEDWPGNCYGIASKMIDRGVVKGKLRYGHFLGKIKPGTMFYNKPIARHGWVEVKEKGKVIIVDPTRWVFEGAEPYIFVSEDTKKEYDAGGQVHRANTLRPPPEFNKKDKEIKTLKLNREAEEYVLGLLGHPYFTIHGLLWIANLPIKDLGKYAKEVYIALRDSDNEALVPIDNFRLVMEG